MHSFRVALSCGGVLHSAFSSGKEISSRSGGSCAEQNKTPLWVRQHHLALEKIIGEKPDHEAQTSCCGSVERCR